MKLTVPRGQPGAVLALGVLCAHGLALQALDLRALPAPGLASAPGLRVHTIELAFARPPETTTTEAPVTPGRAANDGPPGAGATVPPPLTAAADATPAQASATSTAASTAASGTPVTPARTTTLPVRIAPPLHLHYEVSGHTRERAVTGQAELSWQHDGVHYEARLDQDGEGLVRRRQHSAGQITPRGLAPRRYAERTRHEEAVHFERGDGRAVFSANRPPAPLQSDAQDRLSLLLQLGARIAARPRAYPPGSHLEIQTATTREATIWRFQVEGREELRLPGGHQDTLRLMRRPVGEFEPRLEVWLAPGLDYAPVRMRLTQPTGDHLDYRWSGTDRP